MTQGYRAECMYWELYSLAARWFYLAALPSLFPYYHPAQVLVGVAASLLIMQVHSEIINSRCCA